MEHSTEILYNKTEVYCSTVHRFGSDALLLARFCEPRRSQKAADLCSGCGIVSLEWHDRGHRGLCAAVELQPEASALLQEAVAAQGIEHITPYLTDLRTFREGEGQFDVCACNPPYFTAGPQSTDAGRATARHETDCTLEDVCACRFPPAERRRKAFPLPSARAPGRGAGCAAGASPRAEASGLCEE